MPDSRNPKLAAQSTAMIAAAVLALISINAVVTVPTPQAATLTAPLVS